MDYSALFNAGISQTTTEGVKVFAGAVDDPTFIDAGALYDTLNFRTSTSGILSPTQDAASQNYASDTRSGYAVNAIAIEIPVPMLTRTGVVESATSPAATIGVWGTTSRTAATSRRSPKPPTSRGAFKQVQRVGNPFIQDLIIGLSSKDRFAMDQPKKDAQFLSYFSDPLLARFYNAAYGEAIVIPAPPRTDLALFFNYTPPIASVDTPPGPTADLLRLNTGVEPTVPANASRLGLLGGDSAGYPNGRRLVDDVLDIILRSFAGGSIRRGHLQRLSE